MENMDCEKWNNDSVLINFDENGIATFKKIEKTNFQKVCENFENYRLSLRTLSKIELNCLLKAELEFVERSIRELND